STGERDGRWQIDADQFRAPDRATRSGERTDNRAGDETVREQADGASSVAAGRRRAVVHRREEMMTFSIRALVATIAAASMTAIAAGQNDSADWPQWRGPNRDGTLTTFTEPRSWPEQLTRRWKIEIGTGYATPIVVGNRVYAFSRQQDNEVMRAIDA